MIAGPCNHLQANSLLLKDLARVLKYGRVGETAGFDGQHMGREHRVADGDVVELHT